MINTKVAVSIEDLVKDLAANMSKTDLVELTTLLELSNSIEAKRKNNGWTQKEFAKKMGVTQGMVSKWESGEYNFSVKGLAEISIALDMEFKCQLIKPEEVQHINEAKYKVSSEISPKVKAETKYKKNKVPNFDKERSMVIAA